MPCPSLVAPPHDKSSVPLSWAGELGRRLSRRVRCGRLPGWLIRTVPVAACFAMAVGWVGEGRAVLATACSPSCLFGPASSLGPRRDEFAAAMLAGPAWFSGMSQSPAAAPSPLRFACVRERRVRSSLASASSPWRCGWCPGRSLRPVLSAACLLQQARQLRLVVSLHLFFPHFSSFCFRFCSEGVRRCQAVSAFRRAGIVARPSRSPSAPAGSILLM